MATTRARASAVPVLLALVRAVGRAAIRVPSRASSGPAVRATIDARRVAMVTIDARPVVMAMIGVRRVVTVTIGVRRVVTGVPSGCRRGVLPRR